MRRRSQAAGAMLAAVGVVAVARANDPLPPSQGSSSGAWEAGSGVVVRMPLPPAAQPVASAALPQADVSQVSGAKIVLRRGVTRGVSSPEHLSETLHALCVRAPGSHFVPGVEDTAFEKLDSGVQAELARTSGHVEQFSPGKSVSVGHTIEQPYSGTGSPAGVASRPGMRNRLEGKHVLGFVGEPPEMIVCTLACVETCTEGNQLCPGVIKAARVEAAFVPQPRPGLLARAAFTASRKPLAVLGLLLGGLLALAGVAVAAWPGRAAAKG